MIGDEPYDGFFEQKGVLSGDELWCDFGSWFIKRFDANDLSEDTLLIVFPVIAAGHYLYVNQKDHILVSERDKQSKKGVRISNPIRFDARITAGKDQKQVIQPTLDALTQAKCPHWLGYVTTITTSNSDQTIVLDDDLTTARERTEQLVTYATKTAEEVYGRISERRVRGFLKWLPKIYEELAETLVESANDALEIVAKLNETDDELSDDERIKINAQMNAPLEAWFERYETALKNVGISDAEIELEKRVMDYCVQQKMIVHLPKVEYGHLRKDAFWIAVGGMML